MIIPIRCFTCNKILANLWEEYLNRIQLASLKEDIANNPKKRFIDIETLENKTVEGKILDELGLNKYCCRTLILTQKDLCEII